MTNDERRKVHEIADEIMRETRFRIGVIGLGSGILGFVAGWLVGVML